MSLDRLRERAGDFVAATARERLELCRSPLRRPMLGVLYARSEELFGLERISQAQRAVAEATGAEERRARFLLEYLAWGRSWAKAGPALDERLNFRRFGTVTVGDTRVAAAELPRALAGTGDPQERAALAAAWNEAMEVERPVLWALLERRREAYDALAYDGSFLTTCEVLSSIDLRGIARDADRFLQESAGAFGELLGWYLPRLAGVEPGAATAADLPRLDAAPDQAGVFADTDALGPTRAMLASAGLDPRAGGRLRVVESLDLAPGCGAVCRPLEVPDDVVLLLAPRPGRYAHAGALGALGCALHRAFTDPALPLEYRWLGEPSVPRGYGRMLEALLCEPAFLRDRYRLSGERLRGTLRHSALLLLLRLRRAAALLCVAVEWAESRDDDGLGGMYAEALHAATGVRHDPRAALAALRLPFEAAWRLRAHLLGLLLSDYFRDRHDEDWYRNPRAGGALLELYRSGQEYRASELAVQLGADGLSFAPALRRLRDLAA